MTAPSYCLPTDIQMALPNLSELKNLSAVAGNGQTWNDILTNIIDKCSRFLDRVTWRKPGAYAVTVPSTRSFDGKPVTATDYITTLWIDELAVAPTSVSVSRSGSLQASAFTPLNAATDYFMMPSEAPDEGKPYNEIQLNTIDGTWSTWPIYPQSVKVTGLFGYSQTPPPEIVECTIIWAAKVFNRGKLGFADKQSYLSEGAIFSYLNKMDSDIERMKLLFQKTRW